MNLLVFRNEELTDIGRAEQFSMHQSAFVFQRGLNDGMFLRQGDFLHVIKIADGCKAVEEICQGGWAMYRSTEMNPLGGRCVPEESRQVVGTVPVGTSLPCPSSLRSDGDASCWKEAS